MYNQADGYDDEEDR